VVNLSWRALLTSGLLILVAGSAAAEDGGEHAWGMARRLGSVRLGVRVTPTTQQLRETLGVGADEGALVMEVTHGGLAQAAGLRAGDVLTHVGGTPVESARDIARALSGTTAGTRVDVRWVRNRMALDTRISLAAAGRPRARAQPLVAARRRATAERALRRFEQQTQRRLRRLEERLQRLERERAAPTAAPHDRAA
jgi:C-terminal processing protease CtpA/Prc